MAWVIEPFPMDDNDQLIFNNKNVDDLLEEVKKQEVSSSATFVLA